MLALYVIATWLVLVSGIAGFDESYLLRWIGYGFGSLLLLNHFVGLESTAITHVQLVRRTWNLELYWLVVVIMFSSDGFVLVLCIGEYRCFGSFLGFVFHCTSLPW